MPNVEKQDQQIVFIVGSGRSGTTLLRDVLEKHSQISVSPELKFFSGVFTERKTAGAPHKTPRARATFAEKAVEPLEASADEKVQEVKDETPNLKEKLKEEKNMKNMFLRMLEETSETENADVLVEKTPAHIFFLEDIYSFFPDAKFIHVVRHSESFAASAMKRGWFKSVPEAAVHWNESIRAWNRFATEDRKNQCLEVTYEDLVKNTEKTIQKVFEFLSLSPPDQSFYERLNTLESKSPFSKEKHKGIHTDAIVREYFSPKQKESLYALTKNFLREKGYDTNRENISILDRVRYYLYLAKFRIRHKVKKYGFFGAYKRIVQLFRGSKFTL